MISEVVVGATRCVCCLDESWRESERMPGNTPMLDFGHVIMKHACLNRLLLVTSGVKWLELVLQTGFVVA